MLWLEGNPASNAVNAGRAPRSIERLDVESVGPPVPRTIYTARAHGAEVLPGSIVEVTLALSAGPTR